MLGPTFYLTCVKKAVVFSDLSGQEQATEEGLRCLSEDGGDDNSQTLPAS